jgi:hypothetical protein
MKRVGNLYPAISETANLHCAFWEAAKGKSDRREVIAFRADFAANIEKLRRQIVLHRPEIGGYRFFHVRDPKRRLICAAAFPERVLHHAIMNICEPVLETYAIHDSYACRPGKGSRLAVARVQEFAKTHANGWFLKLDIAKYFDTIDHQVLLAQLARRFKDRELFLLFQKLLAVYCTEPGRGLPIGNLVSQHLANFYLGQLDHWLKEERRIKPYLRYMDDFVLFAAGHDRLREELDKVRAFVEGVLRLRLNANVQLNRCTSGIPFLGYRVFPGGIRLSARSKKRFREKFRIYEKMWLAGRWSEDDLARRMEPLIDFTRPAEASGLRSNVIERYGVLS